MEFASAHDVFPEWNLWHSFVAEIMTTAHELDAMHSTHAIEVRTWTHCRARRRASVRVA